MRHTQAQSENRPGSELPDGKEVPSERKTVTVLFADISGFTSMSDRLDPEEAVEVINRCFQEVTDILHRYEGTIDKYIGDCVMALFGAPVTHENDTEQAVRAALEILDSLEELQQISSFPLEIHIGINCGLVVAGNIGSDLRMQYTVIGDVVNLAARLQEAARPGQILVGESVYRLTKDVIDFAEGGELTLKGKSEPVRVYVPLRAHPQRPRFHLAQQRGLTPFVGRETELPVLQAAFDKAAQGSGQAVGIRGEAGIGKSRLLHEFRRTLAADVLYLEGRCVPHGGASAYQPLIGMLRQYWSLPERMTAQVREKLVQQLDGIEEYLPCFEELLSLPSSNPEYAQLTPQVRRRRTFEGLIALLRQAADAQPIILAIEDLHWIDPTSRDFIATLMDTLACHRILLILLSRPEFQPPWQEHASYTSLLLSLLPHSDGHRLVQALFDRPVAAELEEFILGRTEGNPFFAEELACTLRETQALTCNGCYTLSRPPEELEVPDTIQGVLAARMDHLHDEKYTLQVASVIGQEFAVPILRRVLATDGELEGQLGILSEAEFIYSKQPDDLTFAFRHALTREVAYETLLRRTRRDLHRQVGDAIQELLPELLVTQPEILAHHYTEAGLPDQAIPYWQRAGQRSTQRSAHAEAINQLTRGLELLKSLPDTPERSQQELALQIALGVPLISLKGYAALEAERAYARARELCRQVGETTQLSPVLRGLWGFYHHRAEFRTARELGEQLVALAQSAHDPGLLLEAHRMLGITLFGLGELASARAHLEQGMTLYDPVQHRSHAFLYGQDPRVAYLSQATLALCLLGYPDQALKGIHEALSLAQEIAHPFSLAGALFCAAMVHQLRREAGEALGQAEATVLLSTEHGFPFFLTQGIILRGWAWSEQGRKEEGIGQMRQGLAAYRATGAEFVRPHYLALLAEAHGKAGRPEEGLSVLDEALDLIDRHGERRWEAELYRLKGELILMRHPADADIESASAAEADACFLRSIDVARGQGANSLELRAVMSLSRLCLKQDLREGARRLLVEIYSRFTEGFTTADLQEAKALLDELE